MDNLKSTLGACYDITKGVLGNMASYSSVSKIPAPVQEIKPIDPAIVVKHLSSSPWIKLAAVCGSLAVIFGAYGAHGMQVGQNVSFLIVFISFSRTQTVARKTSHLRDGQQVPLLPFPGSIERSTCETTKAGKPLSATIVN